MAELSTQGQIFDESDYLRITVYIKKLAAADIKSVKIRYKIPQAETWAEWDATHDPVTNSIFYDFPISVTLKSIAEAEELTAPGLWQFRGVATMIDDRVINGTIFREMIYKTES